MEYDDVLYGKVNIDEPVILDIISSDFFQRLKKISQGGYNYENLFKDHVIYQDNRFDHSIGCYLLVKKFGAKIEEQVAALLHDISHTIFSHCIDYALSENPEKQEFQDDEFVKYIGKTNILEILKKYNLDADYILNEKNFSLQEKSLPDLCADRIDYSLRAFLSYLRYDYSIVKKYLDNLMIYNNIFIFKDEAIALDFANDFMCLNKIYYSGKETAVMFFTNSNYIKYALNKKYIDYDDLFTTEDFVINKINENIVNDNILKDLWIQINADFDKFSFDNNDYSRKIVCKSRAVNPPFLENGEFLRVCDKFPDYKIKFDEENKPKEYYVKYNE